MEYSLSCRHCNQNISDTFNDLKLLFCIISCINEQNNRGRNGIKTLDRYINVSLITQVKERFKHPQNNLTNGPLAVVLFE